MIVMIDGVLTYSTVSALEEIYEPVNLNEVLKSVEIDLELVIQQKGATIRYSNLPTLEGAPILLHQLFYNLVNNALKFTKPDVPPVITLSSEIKWTEGKELAHIILQDNGIGFEQEFADQIFGTFTRLHPKDRYEGSGLGLALCKNIVERHGGTITAHGIPNGGASFEITLPVRR
jgi:signal transduction histidine kinase